MWLHSEDVSVIIATLYILFLHFFYFILHNFHNKALRQYFFFRFNSCSCVCNDRLAVFQGRRNSLSRPKATDRYKNSYLDYIRTHHPIPTHFSSPFSLSIQFFLLFSSFHIFSFPTHSLSFSVFLSAQSNSRLSNSKSSKHY